MKLSFKKIAASLVAGIALFHLELSQANLELDVEARPNTSKPEYKLTVTLTNNEDSIEPKKLMETIQRRGIPLNEFSFLSFRIPPTRPFPFPHEDRCFPPVNGTMRINGFEEYTSSKHIVGLSALLGHHLTNIRYLRLEGFDFSNTAHTPTVFINFPLLYSLHLDRCMFGEGSDTSSLNTFFSNTCPSILREFWFSGGRMVDAMLETLGRSTGNTLELLSLQDIPMSLMTPSNIHENQHSFPQLRILRFTLTPERRSWKYDKDKNKFYLPEDDIVRNSMEYIRGPSDECDRAFFFLRAKDGLVFQNLKCLI